MRRLLKDVKLSRLPQYIGNCAGDTPRIAQAVNSATQRLMYEGGEWGWTGCWDRVVFNVQQSNPYITMLPKYSRIIGATVCKFPIRLQNEFYEVMEAGIGLRGPLNCNDLCSAREAYMRGFFPTLNTPTQNQILRVYLTDPTDAGKTVLIQNATDQNGNGIYSQINGVHVNGFALTLQSPFTTSTFTVNSFSAVTKDVTNGDVVLTQVDPNTANEVQLSRYLPNETNPAYQRYYLGQLPNDCCSPGSATSETPGLVQVTALCKLEYYPVANDLDQLIIGNIEALIEETQSINYSTMETQESMALEDRHHKKAINLLQSELDHYYGPRNMPAVNFAPFGTARLECQGIGLLM